MKMKSICTKNGFLVDEGMVSPYFCTQLIDQFSHDLLMTHELIKSVLDNGILRSALEKFFCMAFLI